MDRRPRRPDLLSDCAMNLIEQYLRGLAHAGNLDDMLGMRDSLIIVGRSNPELGFSELAAVLEMDEPNFTLTRTDEGDVVLSTKNRDELAHEVRIWTVEELSREG